MQKGLQRRIRQMARPVPFRAPYFVIASQAYWEQVGVKRQRAGKQGEICLW